MAQCLRSVSTKFLSTSYLGNGTLVLSKNFEAAQFGSGGILSPGSGLCTLAVTSKQTNCMNNFAVLHPSVDRECTTLPIPKIKALMESTGTVIQLHSQLFSAPPAPVPKPKEKPNDFVPPNNDNSENNTSKGLDGKPSADQLKLVADVLQKTLPKVFAAPMDYKIYSPDVVIIDNVRGKTYKGLVKLIQQVALLRIVGHLKYAFVNLELLSCNQVPTEGRVTVRCRIKGISGLRVMLKFWQYKVWKYKEVMSQHEVWHDLIIHFDVDASTGLIDTVTLDKVIEDKDQAMDDQKSRKLNLAAKLAGASGAFASPIFVGALDNISAI